MEFYTSTHAEILSRTNSENSDETNWFESENIMKQLSKGVKWYHKSKNHNTGILKVDFENLKTITHITHNVNGCEKKKSLRLRGIVSIIGNTIVFRNNINTESTSFRLPLEKGFNSSIPREQKGYAQDVVRFILID